MSPPTLGHHIGSRAVRPANLILAAAAVFFISAAIESGCAFMVGIPLSGRAIGDSDAQYISTSAAQSTFRKLFDGDTRPVVLFDGVCNMCNGAVDVALDRDPNGKLRYSALQSDIGRRLLVFCGREADDLSSMLVVQPDGKCLSQSDAALFVGRQLDGPLQGASEVACRILPKAVRDVAYGALAANRYRVLGQRQDVRVGKDGRDDRFIGQVQK